MPRLTSVFIALLLTVFLLAFPRGNGYTTMLEFKYGLFLAVCGGYVLVMVIFRTMRGITGTQPFVGIKASFFGIPHGAKLMLVYLFFTMLSAVFSPYQGAFRGPFRQEGALTVGIYVLCSVFVSVYFRPQKWMLFLLGLVVLPMGVIALVQLTGANPFMLYPLGHNFYGAGVYYTGEFLSTVGNSGLLAAFLSLGVGVLAMALIKLDFAHRWFLALPLFMAALLVFVIGIDAALVAVLAGLALMLPVAVTCRGTLVNTLLVFSVVLAAFMVSRMLVFGDGIMFAMPSIVLVAGVGFGILLAALVAKAAVFEKITAGQYRIGAFAAMFGAIGLVLVYLWLYSGEPRGMVYEASQVLRGNWEDTFGTRRVFIWRNVLERVNRRVFLIGTGPDTLGYWDIPHFYRVDDAGRVFITNIDAAHNELLHIFISSGVFALLAYLGAVVLALANWIRRPGDVLSAVAGAGVLFYMIQGMFGISQFISAIFFWVCFGILCFSHGGQEGA